MGQELKLFLCVYISMARRAGPCVRKLCDSGITSMQ